MTTSGGRCVIEWSAPGLGRVELMANIVLFAPPVALVAVLTRRPAVALLTGSVTSVVIEAVQAFFTPLGRACSTNDWLYNTIGAALGALIGAVALALAHRRSIQHPAGRPPT